MATSGYPTDEELILMTTIQLRNLLEQRIISQEQHRELRSRRRRLQNRKYARRCAKKKQTEVAELADAAKKESYIIKSLRQQLFRLNTSVDRIDHQIAYLTKLHLSISPAPPTIRMLSADGVDLGVAFINPSQRPIKHEKGRNEAVELGDMVEEEVNGIKDDDVENAIQRRNRFNSTGPKSRCCYPHTPTPADRMLEGQRWDVGVSPGARTPPPPPHPSVLRILVPPVGGSIGAVGSLSSRRNNCLNE